MKNTFGNNVSVTLFGESHGGAVGVVLDGIPSGVKIDRDFIKAQLLKRKVGGKISTARAEKDEFKIISGVNGEYTIGTPICIIIENTDVNTSDYENFRNILRPSHADYSAFAKYGEIGLLSGGGHFSGRLTAPIVAAGAIAISVLREKGILIGTHIKSIHNVCDRDFLDFDSDINKLNGLDFAVLDGQKAELMKKEILSASENKDSVGGVLETAVTGLKAGVGEPWFDTLEGMLSHGLFSIPAVKGIEFGKGFDITKEFGSNANDEFYIKNNEIHTKTNNSGGINGGISNGEPIIFRLAVKPTPTIEKEQNSVNIKTKEETAGCFGGRHDPCIVHRARVVADSITALVILDMLSQNLGTKGLKNQ